MSTDHIQNLLIIVNGEPSKVMDRKSRDKFDQMHDLKNYTLEFFNIDDLVFDITKHDLVPLHKPINL
jgi:DNA-directed RNA polymerase I, II, and III subunit RPABC1